MSKARQGSVPAAQSYLLDTSVISALAPGREAHLSAGFADWLQTHDAQLFIPCIAIAGKTGKFRVLVIDPASEIEDGLEAYIRANLPKFGLSSG